MTEVQCNRKIEVQQDEIQREDRSNSMSLLTERSRALSVHYALIVHAATHCNPLQHAAARCNTLQHTATQ